MSRKIGLALVVACVVALAACSSIKPTSPAVQRLDSPPLGIERTEELGETLLVKGQLRTYNALLTGDTYVWKNGLGVEYTYPAQAFREWGRDDNWVFYAASEARPRDFILGDLPWTPYGSGFARSLKNPNKLAHFNGSVIMLGDVVGFPAYEMGQVEVVSETSFKQELIYNGRTGSTVRFLYRESSGGVLRAPLTQEVQYDLAEGNVIGFKGARLEVITATNASITYRVLASFPS